jgi:hypothetical protein
VLCRWCFPALGPRLIEMDLNRADIADPAFRERRLARIPLEQIGVPDDGVGPGSSSRRRPTRGSSRAVALHRRRADDLGRLAVPLLAGRAHSGVDVPAARRTVSEAPSPTTEAVRLR